MAKQTIIIAEDHTILRDALRELFDMGGDYQVVGEARDGLEAIRLAGKHQPDIILLDLSMPKMDGLAAIKEIKQQSPETKILILTFQKDENFVLEAFQSGADGYCLKDATYDELCFAVRKVIEGKKFISPEIAENVLEGYMQDKKRLKTVTAWDAVTQREKEIMKLIAEGYNSQTIADLLYISEKTVRKHRSNIMRKLDLHNAAAVTALAISKGLV